MNKKPDLQELVQNIFDLYINNDNAHLYQKE